MRNDLKAGGVSTDLSTGVVNKVGGEPGVNEQLPQV